ncbi:MAG TPA: hypothetical protein PKC12_03210 [Thiobacillaceae bacterium]|nr:hypothetical protein [Thiobacillaceae bacterium]
MITRALTAIFLLLPVFAAAAAVPIVPGEAFALAPGSADARPQWNPAVAWDGKDTYLVVWQQGRLYHATQQADILAVRVDARGRVLDRAPIVICNVEGSQEQPQAVFSGGRFLAAWHDLRNGRDWDVYAARVRVDGRVLEPGGFLVAGGRENQASPMLAPATAGFLVVWQHHARHYQLQAALIPASAGAPAPFPLTFRGDALWGGGHALARARGGWLLSWNDEKGWAQTGTGMITRHFAWLAERGGRPEVRDVQRAPAVALGRSGGRFAGDGASSVLYAGWGVAGRGSRIASAALFGPGRASAHKNPNPEPTRRLSGWNTERMIPLYDFAIPVDGPVAAAFGQGGYLVVARDAYSGAANERRRNRLLGTRLTTAGARIDVPSAPQVLHQSPHRVARPALAGGNQQFLLAFEQEDAAGARRIWAKILKGAE